LGACDGGEAKPGVVGGTAGAVVCWGVALFDTIWVGGRCPTPKAKPNPRKITRHTRPAIAVGRLMPVNRIVGKAVIGHVDLLTLAH
jgi:hypothetical protein